MRAALWILMVSFAALVGCQTKPTQVKLSSSPVEDAKSFAARILETKPAILDVRSDIDFGMSHVPGSVNVRWQDLNQNSGPRAGALDQDRHALARRFALWGVDPKTPVLVVGMGPEGRGEEGRVAWALRLLGVESIETASVRIFRQQNPRPEDGRPENKAFWKPESRNELEISKTEFEKLAKEPDRPVTKARAGALGGAAHLGSPTFRVILDVSHPNERRVRSVEDLKPHWPVIRSSWRAFYDEHGRGSCSQAVAELSKHSVGAQHEILIVDTDGVGAAATGFVLASCRFGKPRVLSTGL